MLATSSHGYTSGSETTGSVSTVITGLVSMTGAVPDVLLLSSIRRIRSARRRDNSIIFSAGKASGCFK